MDLDKAFFNHFGAYILQKSSSDQLTELRLRISMTWAAVISLFFLFHSSDAFLAPIAARLPVPGKPAPPGTPWPFPRHMTSTDDLITIGNRPNLFQKLNFECPVLNRAVERYNWEFFFKDLPVEQASGYPVLTNVLIEVPTTNNFCDDYPRFNTSQSYEQYKLQVKIINSDSAEARISADTAWGALRGLETFSQLLWRDMHNRDSVNYFLNVTDIEDYPRFPHRGVMIDTARHYIDIPIIKTLIDAISHMKLNVLHWHIVDDQSFPFVSSTFPSLSRDGSYLPELTYEPNEVKDIIDYSRDRGVRVVLEFDTPGHTRGFGKAYPELLTPCYGDGVNPGTPDYPNHADYEILDPTKEFTYTFMRDFFTEIASNVSVDEYLHLGMDEVYYACWESSPEIAKFMSDNGYTEMRQVQQHYTERHLNMISGLNAKSIIWQDPLDFGVSPSKDVLIQIWKDDWNVTLPSAIKLGYDVLLSSCWYLNYINYGESWRNYFECDPVNSLDIELTPEEQSQIKGGEAALWAEYVDSTNFLPRLIPNLGAVAERLWSTYNATSIDDAMHRIDQFRCLLLWRGFPSQPISNGYCSSYEKSRQHK